MNNFRGRIIGSGYIPYTFVSVFPLGNRDKCSSPFREDTKI